MYKSYLLWFMCAIYQLLYYRIIKILMADINISKLIKIKILINIKSQRKENATAE